MINIKTYTVPKKSSGTTESEGSGGTTIVNNEALSDKWFYYNDDYDAVCCRYNFYSVGNVAAYGADADSDNYLTPEMLEKLRLLANKMSLHNNILSVDTAVDISDISPKVLYYNDTTGELASSTYTVTFTDDLSDFEYVRCFFRPSLHNASDSNAIPSAIVEINLDNVAKMQSGEYTGSTAVPYINNDNRYASYVCMISADKTQFRVVRQTSLYGTAGNNISNASHGIYCYRIEGIKQRNYGNVQVDM